MATIEERLKQHIKDNYGSIRSFVLAKGLNYANVDSILRRGIRNATWNSVKALCEALEISVDELADDRIVPIKKDSSVTKVESIIEAAKLQIMSGTTLTINNKPATQDELVLLCSALDVALELIKKQQAG